MLGVSGGIEPMFQLEYNRKTVTLNEGETTYKVVSPIVKEYREVTGQWKELPSYFVTAYDIPYRERVDMQSAVQKYIDSAISSTVNLPEDTTVEEVEDLYMYAWKKKLKGITVYRDNCFRAGILTSEDKPKVKDKTICPSCGGTMIITNGCSECQDCGSSMCSI